MPPSASVLEYCDYIIDGYFGYSWQEAVGGFGTYPCPRSARNGSNGHGQLSCLIDNKDENVTFPPGAIALCGHLQDGWFGWEGR